MWCLHVILGVTKWGTKRNTGLRSMAGIEMVDVMVMRRKLHWLGHLERLDDTRLPKCLLVCCPHQAEARYFGSRAAPLSSLQWSV